jgi:hypothetical protein
LALSKGAVLALSKGAYYSYSHIVLYNVVLNMLWAFAKQVQPSISSFLFDVPRAVYRLLSLNTN